MGRNTDAYVWSSISWRQAPLERNLCCGRCRLDGKVELRLAGARAHMTSATTTNDRVAQTMHPTTAACRPPALVTWMEALRMAQQYPEDKPTTHDRAGGWSSMDASRRCERQGESKRASSLGIKAPRPHSRKARLGRWTPSGTKVTLRPKMKAETSTRPDVDRPDQLNIAASGISYGGGGGGASCLHA